MWDGIFLLLSLSGAMAAASFLAGLLPLSISLTKRQLRLISALGTGILVGTALVIIIPEGIDAIYSVNAAPRKSQVHNDGPVRGGQGVGGLHRFEQMGLDSDRDEPEGFRGPNHLKPNKRNEYEEYIRSIGSVHLGRRDKADGNTKDLDRTTSQGDAMKSSDPHEAYNAIPTASHASPHTWIAFSLVLGFALMYIIDALPKLSTTRPGAPTPIALSNLSDGLHPHPASPATEPPPSSLPSHGHAPQTITLGLLIHSFADGIALGAASASAPHAHRSLTVLVFLAILIHKAPAAFGLVALLLKRGASKRSARGHLMAFSLAAPAGALLTWCAIAMFGSWGGAAGDDGGQWWTGCVLIFSGGTFLYVATHSLSEATHGEIVGFDEHDVDLSNPYLSANGNGNGHAYAGYSKPSGATLTRTEIMCTLGGMLLPLLTLGGHGH